jgi:hypothetical protein
MYAFSSNMLLNEKKTKKVIITTPQMSKTHCLGDLVTPNVIKNRTLDRIGSRNMGKRRPSNEHIT